jgi:hypothetical protein
MLGVYDSAPNSPIADKSIKLVNLLAYSTTRSRELALAQLWSAAVLLAKCGLDGLSRSISTKDASTMGVHSVTKMGGTPISCVNA